MSDPLKAQHETPRSLLGQSLKRSELQYAHFTDAEVRRLPGKELKQPAAVLRRVEEAGLDLEVVSSIKWRDEFRGEKGVTGDLMYSDVGGLELRKRDGIHAQMGADCHDALPLSLPRFDYSRETVRERAASVVAAAGGAHYALGRILEHYPRKGEAPPVVTGSKYCVYLVDLLGCGVHEELVTGVRPLKLLDVRANMNAENGFPTLGRGKDKDGVIADSFYKQLELSGQLGREWHDELTRLNLITDEPSLGASPLFSVNKWKLKQVYRTFCEKYPYMLTLRGKAKYDVYTKQKVLGSSLRFYNVLPRCAALYLQQATQPFEGVAMSILHSAESRTFIGAGMARGGADLLVGELDSRLGSDILTPKELESPAGLKQAFVHAGDDSLVVLKSKGKLAVFSLDCTAFDLTQDGRVTEKCHSRIASALAAVDQARAALWYSMMQERLVTISGSVTARMQHGGPSGMPLQSKVNDLLMDSVLRDVTLQFDDEGGMPSQQEVANAVEYVGSQYGLKIRLERYVCAEASTLRQFLEKTPFLFVGYYLWSDGKQVWPYADVPRMLAQLPYATSRGWKKREDLVVSEALKAVGVVLAAGVPPPELLAAHVSLTNSALAALGRMEKQQMEFAKDAIAETLEGYAYAGLEGLVTPTTKGLRAALNLDRQRKIYDYDFEAALIAPPTVVTVECLVRLKYGGDVTRILRARRPVPVTQLVGRVNVRTVGRPPKETPVTRVDALRSLKARMDAGTATREERSRWLYLLQTQDDDEEDAWDDDATEVSSTRSENTYASVVRSEFDAASAEEQRWWSDFDAEDYPHRLKYAGYEFDEYIEDAPYQE